MQSNTNTFANHEGSSFHFVMYIFSRIIFIIRLRALSWSLRNTHIYHDLSLQSFSTCQTLLFAGMVLTSFLDASNTSKFMIFCIWTCFRRIHFSTLQPYVKKVFLIHTWPWNEVLVCKFVKRYILNNVQRRGRELNYFSFNETLFINTLK